MSQGAQGVDPRLQAPAAAADPDPGGVLAAAIAAERETMLERLLRIASEAALVAMIVMIVVEVVGRALFNFSLQVTDELSGYLLVAISFLSLPVCEAHGAFHEVQFVQQRLSERGRLVSRIVFHLLLLLFSLVLTWQFIRFTYKTWDSEEIGQTILFTPLWIPRLTLALGFAALVVTLARKLAVDLRRAFVH